MARQTATTEDVPVKKPVSDRYVGGLLLVFFAALYLLTSSGHLYSPDGEFAFRTARSLTIDPNHQYLSDQRQSLSQWGIMVPLLSQPFIVLGEPLATAMPQKDHATVDGRDYALRIFRHGEVPEDAPDGPTVGPRAEGFDDVYTRMDITAAPSTSLTVISFLSMSTNIPQGEVVAEITVRGSDGSQVVLPLRAGVETAEWSRDRASPVTQHGMAREASRWSGNPGGRNYFAELPFDRALEPASISIRYLAPEGNLFIRSLAFLNQGTGAFTPVDSDYAWWSDRENDEYFALVFYGAYNALVTALGCLLLFGTARLLGYGQAVSAVATLVYGLATTAWPYSKYDFSEPTLTLLVLGSLHLILRWGQDRRGRLLLWAGILALMAAVTKYVAAIVIPVMVLQIALLHWESYPSAGKLRGLVRPLLLFSAPFLAVAAPAIYYLSQRFGYYPSIFEAWAGIQRGWLPLPFEIGLRGLLFSPGRSFFLYSPPAILALISAIIFVRRHTVRSAAILGIVLLYFAIYSKKVAWDAGSGWGPRYQVVVLPLVILLVLPLIQRAIERRHRWSRYALIAVFTLGVGIQLLAVSKNFDFYLGMFRHDIVLRMPDKGAQYGGGDYFPYAEGLSDANTITATVWSWPFSPILAHTWLLSADVLHQGRPWLQPFELKLLGTPPWRLMGIDIVPEQPKNGLGLDFWSTRLWADFPSHAGLMAGVFAILLTLETAVVASGARVVAFLTAQATIRSWAVRSWIAGSALLFLAFDVLHFLL